MVTFVKNGMFQCTKNKCTKLQKLGKVKIWGSRRMTGKVPVSWNFTSLLNMTINIKFLGQTLWQQRKELQEMAYQKWCILCSLSPVKAVLANAAKKLHMQEIQITRTVAHGIRCVQFHCSKAIQIIEVGLVKLQTKLMQLKVLPLHLMFCRWKEDLHANSHDSQHPRDMSRLLCLIMNPTHTVQ